MTRNLMLVMCLLLGSIYVKAQKTHSMKEVVVLTRFEVKKDQENALHKSLGEYVKQALVNEDNIMAEAYYEEQSPAIMWLIERWTTKQVLEKISNSKIFKQVRTLSEKGLVQPVKTIYLKDLEPLSKEEWRREPGKGDTPITIMLFVDSKAGTENRFKEVYHTAMPQFRSEPGVVNYQLSQLEEDSTQFVTYEKFRNEDAFQYHLNFPPIQPVIDYLNSSIKQQPFQAGLHRLIRFAPLDNGR
ncbi:Quinol monooxygenase YgiN [Chitinophaga sp. YR627]|uniref:putative quinol monooxygenase n=1 Tax=Chitinophaga sp. YR627 TaxID=1881041 RepID=UPI0008E1AABC|nr:antibiotic biosynthesis monooxygenase [Chitinophaga sp. YR627]SFO69782.1 Quinol monooxygenase YgiN [Chitinophaga sp. YR627]